MDSREQIGARLDERFDRLEDLVARMIQEQQRTSKEWYTTAEFAQIVGKAEFTVREWCRLGREAGMWVVVRHSRGRLLTRLVEEVALFFPVGCGVRNLVP